LDIEYWILIEHCLMLHHSWDISPRAAIALQRKLAGLVRQEPIGGPVRTIAGVDCAFEGTFRTAGKVLVAAVLCDARTMKVIATAQAVLPCTFPYVPGLLSFREAPAVIEAVTKLPMRPDLLMIDGQGIAHPRGMGIASHVGLWLDMPTIGAAKSRLCGSHRTPGPRRGNRCQLVMEDTQGNWAQDSQGNELQPPRKKQEQQRKKQVVGAVLRTRDDVNPMYISVGHRITLAQAIYWTLRCAISARLPEPTRRAHQYVSRMKA
jgi:deoxyribonuclease V